MKKFKITYHQCCGSGMFIPDPDFSPSWIPDLTKQEEVKKLFKNLLNFLPTKYEFGEHDLREDDLCGYDLRE